jgi:hypothetical protein
VDGVETAVGRSGSFANPFFGTSAAAPHVAGCAALVLGAGAPPAGIGAALLATALDIGGAGADPVAGAGLLDCGAAARLATGSGVAPAVSALQGSFSPTGAVLVSGTGVDADGDARLVTVRVLDSVGVELTREEQRLAPAGAEFQFVVELRDAVLAGAREVTVEAADATGLASPPARVALGCPGDGSLGDVFCGVGDLLVRLPFAFGGGRARLVRDARAAARVLVRAGGASSGPRRAVSCDEARDGSPASSGPPDHSGADPGGGGRARGGGPGPA